MGSDSEWEGEAIHPYKGGGGLGRGGREGGVLSLKKQCHIDHPRLVPLGSFPPSGSMGTGNRITVGGRTSRIFH